MPGKRIRKQFHISAAYRYYFLLYEKSAALATPRGENSQKDKKKAAPKGAPPCNRAYKPGSVNTPCGVSRNHLSSPPVTGRFGGTCPPATRGVPAGSRSPGNPMFPTYGVASDRVYICRQLPALPVSSYLAFPSLPRDAAVYFCCTFPGVTPGGRYPLSRPAKPGLSSRYDLSA